MRKAIFVLLVFLLGGLIGCDEGASEEVAAFDAYFEGAQKFDCDSLPPCYQETLDKAETCAQGLTFTSSNGDSCHADTFFAWVDSWDTPTKIDIADSDPAAMDPLWCATYVVSEGSETYTPSEGEAIPFTFSTNEVTYTTPNHESQEASLTVYDTGYVKIACEDEDTSYYSSLEALSACQSELNILSITGSKSSVTVSISPMDTEAGRPVFNCVQGE